MVFDTGVGPTRVSAKLASQLGLKATDRTVACPTADGTEVMAKEMIIRTVAFGRLTFKNVTCVVMPEYCGDVAPWLGQSVLHGAPATSTARDSATLF